MTSTLTSHGRLVGCAATSLVVVVVARDLHRARRMTRLEPPVPSIDVRVAPPRAAGDGHSDRVTADAEQEQRAPIRLAALGDSSIAGAGATRLSTCLAVQIAERVAATRDRPVHIRGHGVSGARTADVARQAKNLDAAEPPDVVVVVAGANDVAHLTSPWRYVRAVGDVHRALRDRFDTPVVVCSLPEFRALTVVGQPLRALAVAYGRLLGVLQRRALRRVPGVRWVDGRRLAGPTFRQRPDAMAADGYHPSDLGYALLADALAPAVVSVLESSPRVVTTSRSVEHTFYTGGHRPH